MRKNFKSIQRRLVKMHRHYLHNCNFTHVGEEVGLSAGVFVGVIIIIVGVIGGACIIAR